jgi:hypothetical protein
MKVLVSENPPPASHAHYRDELTAQQTQMLLRSTDSSLVLCVAVASLCSLLAALESIRAEQARQEAQGAFFGQPFNLR